MVNKTYAQLSEKLFFHNHSNNNQNDNHYNSEHNY
jgi:hypothetical protein